MASTPVSATSITTHPAPVGPSISDIVAFALKAVDTNSDGVFSASELSALQMKLKIDATTFKAGVAKIDANGDGAISKAELTAYVTKGDADGDGHISLSEAHALVPLIGVHADHGHGHG